MIVTWIALLVALPLLRCLSLFHTLSDSEKGYNLVTRLLKLTSNICGSNASPCEGLGPKIAPRLRSLHAMPFRVYNEYYT